MTKSQQNLLHNSNCLLFRTNQNQNFSFSPQLHLHEMKIYIRPAKTMARYSQNNSEKIAAWLLRLNVS